MTDFVEIGGPPAARRVVESSNFHFVRRPPYQRGSYDPRREAGLIDRHYE